MRYPELTVYIVEITLKRSSHSYITLKDVDEKDNWFY